jgi:hypothetical protein
MATKKPSRTRTNMYEDRIVDGHERTFSSWMWHGLGATMAGWWAKAVFGAFEPTWAAKATHRFSHYCHSAFKRANRPANRQPSARNRF